MLHARQKLHTLAGYHGYQKNQGPFLLLSRADTRQYDSVLLSVHRVGLLNW